MDIILETLTACTRRNLHQLPLTNKKLSPSQEKLMQYRGLWLHTSLCLYTAHFTKKSHYGLYFESWPIDGAALSSHRWILESSNHWIPLLAILWTQMLRKGYLTIRNSEFKIGKIIAIKDCFVSFCFSIFFLQNCHEYNWSHLDNYLFF